MRALIEDIFAAACLIAAFGGFTLLAVGLGA